MNRFQKMALITASLLTLSGCVSLDGGRQVHKREIVWAKKGTPARIVDDASIKVLVPDGADGWAPAKAKLTGMIAIDEPTLEYYQNLHEKAQGSGGQ